MNAHIGVLDTPNARWWGAKLYRKIGSGTWQKLLKQMVIIHHQQSEEAIRLFICYWNSCMVF